MQEPDICFGVHIGILPKIVTALKEIIINLNIKHWYFFSS